MRLKLAIWFGLALYALLSATDWVMTYTLLRLHPGAVEANPVAAACLSAYGWNGLAIYKSAGVLVFAGAVVLLIRRRPAVAASVVTFGCAVLLWVTYYSHTLICEAHREAAERPAWPKRKLNEGQPAASIPVPEGCWFATTSSATTASLK
jgi:hypothetical protein